MRTSGSVPTALCFLLPPDAFPHAPHWQWLPPTAGSDGLATGGDTAVPPTLRAGANSQAGGAHLVVPAAHAQLAAHAVAGGAVVDAHAVLRGQRAGARSHAGHVPTRQGAQPGSRLPVAVGGGGVGPPGTLLSGSWGSAGSREEGCVGRSAGRGPQDRRAVKGRQGHTEGAPGWERPGQGPAPPRAWRHLARLAPAWPLAPPLPREDGTASRRADLQVGDVPVDVHRGRHTVLGDVLVVAGARLAVHSVDAGNGDPLVAPGDVPAREGVSPSLR